MRLAIIGAVPDLFGQEARGGGKIFHRPQVARSVTAGREFVMAALAREQGPWPPDAPSDERAAVVALAVAVVVVAQPAGACGEIALEDRVDHLQRILDQGI